jgi:hypothetical protein
MIAACPLTYMLVLSILYYLYVYIQRPQHTKLKTFNLFPVFIILDSIELRIFKYIFY